MKVLRYFPSKARLQRMFAIPLQASFQTWYMANKSIDGLVRLSADSLQWQEIDKIDQSFTVKHQNLHLGLARDGVNPFSIKGEYIYVSVEWRAESGERWLESGKLAIR